ncbi:MAG: translation elongation factor Ts [bacterium]|nr:translation elongation factor Ts [bacterium]
MEITSQIVKELRLKTGAGMMECKKALVEADGNEEKAIEVLRKHGLSKVEKRADRVAKEGVVEAYIHTGAKLGVLLELNSETDFVAKTDEFKRLARDISLHIAASNPLTVSREEIPAGVIEKEKEIYRAQVEGEGKPKPPDIVEKIINGKLDKYFSENCLLEQLFVKDSTKTIGALIAEAAAKFGENLILRRFSRFKVGE